MHNVTGPPVTGEDLFGREAEMASLWRRLNANQHILMLAPRRVGKTSLMHEARRVPRPGWIVFYSELEGAKSPADLVADMIAHLAADKRTKTWLDTVLNIVPFRHSVTATLKRIKSLVLLESLRVDLADALAEEWKTTALRLQHRLAQLPPGTRILFIHDEFPILISRLLRTESERPEAEALLGWLRSVRQDPALAGKVSFLAGGSIGLSGVLRRYQMSAPINDYSPLIVDAWAPAIAREFLQHLGKDNNFVLSDTSIAYMLEILGEAVPYHVQLLFQTVQDLSTGEAELVTPDLIRRAFTDRLAGPWGGPHLAHYAERLEYVLNEEDVLLARNILDATCRSTAGVKRSALSAFEDETNRFNATFEMLVDDGYLCVDGEFTRFRSNLVREYWSRYQKRTGANGRISPVQSGAAH